MAEATTREGALSELFVECPRGHHVHIAWTDRVIGNGTMLDESEAEAVHRFAYPDGLSGPISDTKCPECGVPLHGQVVQAREP